MKDEWMEVSAQNNSTWDLKEPLIGKYISVKEDVGPNHSKMYTIKNDDDENIGMWGSTVLDSKMAEVEIGSLVKVTYVGKAKSPKSGKEYKDFSVLVKRDDTIKMSDIPFGE